VHENLGDKPILQHVVNACWKSAQYLNNWSTKKIYVVPILCVPKGDKIAHSNWGIEIFEGDEKDVLKRYGDLARFSDCRYMVRITGDCPLIPAFIISKCITTAVMNRYDYFSNVDEECRTAPDGFDCEVISKDALMTADALATEAYDREHVTPYIRRDKQKFRQGMLVNFLDLAALKISLDTKEDLDAIRREYGRVEKAVKDAQRIFGKNNVHRF